MQCLSPLSIPRHDGNSRADRIDVPCGKCAACLANKRSQWSFRLEHEARAHSSAFFITLTYDDQYLPINANGKHSVSKRHVQLFLKRLRKRCSEFTLRYYFVSEYGPSTCRPHYHGLIFGLDCLPSQATRIVLDTWQYGMIKVGTVTPASISYCTKYCITREQTPDLCDPVFSLMSKGIGKSYIESHRDFHDSPDHFYGVKPGGVKVPLPRYFSERLYSPETRAHRKAYFKPLLDHEGFLQANPSQNPFKYEYELKNAYSDRLFKNTSKLSKL